MNETFKMFLLVFIGMVLLVALFGFHKSEGAGTSLGSSTGNPRATKEKEKTALGL